MFKHLNAVVRLWAIVDLIISGLLAIPFTALQFIGFLSTFNFGAMSNDVGDGLFLLFVNLAGTYGVVWAISRFFFPNRSKALLDIVARLGITGLIIYYVLLVSAPASLYLLAAVYLLGAFHQLYAFFQRPAKQIKARSSDEPSADTPSA